MKRATARPSDLAWLILLTGVVAYEVAAKPEELLSEAVDRYLAKHKALTTGAILYTALHLVNWLPSWADLFYQAAVLGGKGPKNTVEIDLTITNECQ